jgi:phenylacetic acid degradation operon negative regulatory protein
VRELVLTRGVASNDEDEHGVGPELSARELLVVILGDYWHWCTEPLPSAALGAVLAEFGISQANARAALSRLARRGQLEVSREGRRTLYRTTEETSRWAASRGTLLMRFGLDRPGWDGRWTCVAFSLPDDVNRSGPVLRRGLRRLGMAQLYDGLWVAPSDLTAPLGRLLAEVGVDRSTVFRADVVDLDGKGLHPLDAWDLPALRRRYEDLVGALGGVRARMEQGDLSPRESLMRRTALTARWRQLAYDDPRLPADLLGVDWPLSPARDAFVAVYDGLGPLAEARARQLVARFDLPERNLPRHHCVADLLTD